MKTKLSWLLSAAVILAASAMWSCKPDPVDGGKNENFIDINVKFTGKDKPAAGNNLYVWLYYDLQKANAAGTADVAETRSLSADDIAGGIRITIDKVAAGSKYVLAWADLDGNGSVSKDDLALYYNAVAYDDVKEGSKTPTDVGSTYLLNMNLTVKVGGKPTGDVTDIEGNQYNSKKIGNQTWLRENLRVTKFRDGTAIQTGFTDAEWIKTLIRDTGTAADGTGTPGYCQHPEADIYTDGLLYNWFAASSSKGLCPAGWRTPTETDWQILETFLGMTSEEINRSTNFTGTAGTGLKAVGYGDGTDVHGFSVLPSGQREKDNGTYKQYGVDAFFWASTDARDLGSTGHLQGYRRGFRDTEAGINRYQVHKAAGCSVRCVKDEDVKMTFTVTTNFTADADLLPKAGAELNTCLFFSDPTGKAFSTLTPDKSEKTTLTDDHIANGVKTAFEEIDPKQAEVYVASWLDTDKDGTINDGDFVSFYKGLSFEDVEGGAAPVNNTGQAGVTVEHKMPLGTVIVRGTVTDIDGNEYGTVKIGAQEWMSENMRATKLNNGTAISDIGNDEPSKAAWIGLMLRNDAEFSTDPTHGTGTPAYCKNPEYFSETLNTPGVGYIYNWFAAKELCPTGWKLPSNDDWKVLEAYIGMSAADIDKVANWRGSLAGVLKGKDMGGTDLYGFNLIACGDRNKDTGVFQNNATDVSFWLSSVSDVVPASAASTLQSYQRLFRSTQAGITSRYMSRVYGSSVRCVKDAE